MGLPIAVCEEDCATCLGELIAFCAIVSADTELWVGLTFGEPLIPLLLAMILEESLRLGEYIGFASEGSGASWM